MPCLLSGLAARMLRVKFCGRHNQVFPLEKPLDCIYSARIFQQLQVKKLEHA